MRFLRIYRTEFIVLSAIVIGLLLLANLIKFRYVTLVILAQNKDAISAINSIITTIILIVGAFASYFRFFRGRTLSTKAELELKATLYPTNGKVVLHVIELEITNVGAFPIWEPKVSLVMFKHGLSGEINLPEEVSLWGLPSDEELKENIITVYPQENIQFYAFQRVPKTVCAVTYVAAVRSRNRTMWKRVATAHNHTESLQNR